LATRIAEANLVEDLLPGATDAELDPGVGQRGNAAGDAAADEGQHGGGASSLVQADEEASVGEHAIRMAVGVGGCCLAEAESLVEFHRRADVVDRDAELVERPEQWQRQPAHQPDVPRAVCGRLPWPLVIQAWQCCAIRSARHCAWLVRTLRAGTYW